MKKIKIQEVTTPGCIHCEQARKVFTQEIKKQFPKVDIEYIDMFSKKGMELVQKYSIMASPGIIINGELFATGEIDKNKLAEKIRSLSYMFDQNKLLKFREEKDRAWKQDSGSPLTEEQKQEFKGLNYFPPNPDLSFELELDKNIPDVGSKVIIKTTDGDEQVYLRAGKVKFNVEGSYVEAIVFEDPQQEQFKYYLLFRDQTTGKETYGNGRMLQIPKKADKLVIDFNYAYNPYSSYNDNWNCPITPEENVLPVAIKAGEKSLYE